MNGAPEKKPRRLAAILHADVVGFSSLMSADEAGTHAAVVGAIARAREIAGDEGGRVVSTAGDAFLAEFPSVVGAVAAAVRFQTVQAERAARSAGDAVTFRVGINLGDVIADGDDIFGEGVNVAARVEALAPPGGIAITAAAREQLGNRSGIAFTDGGEHSVKNIPQKLRLFVAMPPFSDDTAAPDPRVVRSRPRPRLILALSLAALVLLAGLVGSVFLRKPQSSGSGTFASGATDGRPVIAVLPFTERGSDAESTYYSDGFTEDVISHLGRFPELLVLSWNAVAPYRDRTSDLARIRSDLNARYVIGGSLQRAGGRLRVNVQLTDARDGILIWSERYETPAADLFELQDRIAGTAAGSLALGVVRQEERAALVRPTEELAAYDLVLQGRAALRRVDRSANTRARARFREALSLDPDYADALSGLAWTHVNEAWWGWSEWPAETIEEGIELARRALDAEPENTPALSALTELYWMRNDFEEAARTCRRAVDANPNDARAHASCGGVLIFSGDLEEGIAHGELALRLDPEPNTWDFTNLGIGYFMTGQYEEAAALLNRASQVTNEDPAPHAVLAAVYARLGREEDARDEVRETLRRSPFFNADVFARNLAATGHSDDLRDAMRLAGFD